MEQFDAKNFVKKSLEYKLQGLQEIHFCVLKCIYNHAISQNAITKDNVFNPSIGQYFLPDDMLSKLNIPGFSQKYLLICLKDLEARGFISNVEENPMKCWAFALTALGLQAVLMQKD